MIYLYKEKYILTFIVVSYWLQHCSISFNIDLIAIV